MPLSRDGKKAMSHNTYATSTTSTSSWLHESPPPVNNQQRGKQLNDNFWKHQLWKPQHLHGGAMGEAHFFLKFSHPFPSKMPSNPKCHNATSCSVTPLSCSTAMQCHSFLKCANILEVQQCHFPEAHNISFLKCTFWKCSNATFWKHQSPLSESATVLVMTLFGSSCVDMQPQTPWKIISHFLF